MKGKFCTILKEEIIKSLTLVKHRPRPRNPIFTQSTFWCAKVKTTNLHTYNNILTNQTKLFSDVSS